MYAGYHFCKFDVFENVNFCISLRASLKYFFQIVQVPDRKSSSKEKKKGKGILRHSETKSFIPLFREPSSIEKILGEADQLLIRPPPTSSERPNSPPALTIRPVSPRPASPKAASHRASSPKSTSPRAPSPRAPSPRVASPRADSPKPAPSKTFSTGAVSPKAALPTAFISGAASSKSAAPSKAAAPKATQSRKEIRHVPRPEPTLRDQQLSATKIQAAYRGYLVIVELV